MTTELVTKRVGIDYSMTCPAACAYGSDGVYFWYAHATKLPDLTNVEHHQIGDGAWTVERAVDIGYFLRDWIIDAFAYCTVPPVAIEDYAYAATGRVFNIGENTGILKALLYRDGIKFDAIPPTVIKKFATGKGNADKHKMTMAFLEAYSAAKEWVPAFFPRLKDDGSPAKSPLADLADAYWIARYSYEKNA